MIRGKLNMSKSHHFNKLLWSIIGAGSVFCSSLSAAEPTYSAGAKIKIDTSGMIAGVWESMDTPSQQYYINSSYGTATFPGTETMLTDPNLFYAHDPKIVVPTSDSATTKAVAIWMAEDLGTKNILIQATILTVLGWNTNILTLSFNDGSEKPNKDYEASISSDGLQIAVIWSAYAESTRQTTLRCATSSNGGLTWNIPQ